MVLLPKLASFAKAYPDVVVDVVTLNEPTDVITGHFDAGIHIGEYIQRDMIAVRVSKDLRIAVVGSTEYFNSIFARPGNSMWITFHLPTSWSARPCGSTARQRFAKVSVSECVGLARSGKLSVENCADAWPAPTGFCILKQRTNFRWNSVRDKCNIPRFKCHYAMINSRKIKKTYNSNSGFEMPRDSSVRERVTTSLSYCRNISF